MPRTKILQIHPDLDPESPREWDNLGRMLCWHNRYSLGDEQPDADPPDYMSRLICDYVNGDFEDDLNDYLDFLVDYKGWNNPQLVEIERDETITDVFEEHFISLPLFLYDHSGISMSCGPFSCPWDSGQVGFIYITREKARHECNSGDKSFPQIRNTPMGDREFASLDELAKYYLQSEVEVYDQYLQGDVYGFVLLDEHGEEEESCWGFFGHNWRTNGMADNVDMSEVKAVHYMEARPCTIMEATEVEELEMEELK